MGNGGVSVPWLCCNFVANGRTRLNVAMPFCDLSVWPHSGEGEWGAHLQESEELAIFVRKTSSMADRLILAYVVRRMNARIEIEWF